MYIPKEIIERVGNVGIIDNNLFFAHDFCLIRHPKTRLIKLEENYLGIDFNPNFLNVYTIRSSNKFYDYNGELLKNFQKRNFKHYLSINQYIFYDRELESTMLNNVQICKGKIGYSIIRRGFFYFEKDGEIFSHCIDNASSKWEYQLSSLGTYINFNKKETNYDVKKFLGIYQNQLLIALNDRFILSLNAETGKFLKLINVCDALQLNEVSFGNMRPYDIYLDKDKGLVLWLSFHYYVKIDATTLEPKLIKNYALGEKEQWWNIKHSTPNDDFIVFNADYGDKRVSPDYLGIANIETGEILWSEKIIKKGFLVDNPQASQDKLYQRDSNNNLYIYEKE